MFGGWKGERGGRGKEGMEGKKGKAMDGCKTEKARKKKGRIGLLGSIPGERSLGICDDFFIYILSFPLLFRFTPPLFSLLKNPLTNTPPRAEISFFLVKKRKKEKTQIWGKRNIWVRGEKVNCEMGERGKERGRGGEGVKKFDEKTGGIGE